MFKVKKLPIFLLLLLALTLNCGSDDSDAAELASLNIESSNGLRLDLGEMTTLSVQGFDAANQPFNVVETITWSANNTKVSIDQNGIVTGVSVGDAVVTATIGTISQSIDLSVWDSTAPRIEIWVSDAGASSNPRYQILKYDENGRNPEVFTTQNLAWPQDILFMEETEVVLVSNLNSGTIDRYNIDTGAFINSFATGIDGPTRMKIGADNLLYVLQWNGDGKVLRYQLDGTFVDEFTDVGVTQSIGMDWDGQGNLYVSSFNDGSVRKFDPAGNDMGLFITTNLVGPTNIWFRPNGDLMINDWSAGLVARFNSSGSFLRNSITGLNRPEGIAFFANGDFLIGNGGTGSVKMYGSNNAFISDLVSSGVGGLVNPNAVVIRKVN